MFFKRLRLYKYQKFLLNFLVLKVRVCLFEDKPPKPDVSFAVDILSGTCFKALECFKCF